MLQEFCFANTDRKCDAVDVDGSSDWWKRHFNTREPLTTELNNTVSMRKPGRCVANTPFAQQVPKVNDDADVYKQTVRKFTCAYDPVSPTTCRLAGQTIASNSVTQTHTKTYSYQGKIGYQIKIKSAISEVCFVFCIEPSTLHRLWCIQATWEQTFDFGYSTSTGDATTKLDGETSMLK